MKKDALKRSASTRGANVLYHYTDAAGLHGILKSSTIWATDSRHLNDTDEIAFSAGAVAAEIRRLAEGLPDLTAAEIAECADYFESRKNGQMPAGPYLAPRRDALWAVANQLDSLDGLGAFTGESRASTFVACFSELGDSLSQWMGYGNSGGGYAIGFSRSALESATHKFKGGTKSHASVLSPQKVLYGKKNRDEYIKRAIEYLVNTGHPELEANPVVEYTKYAMNALSVAVRMSAVSKNKGFSNEEEWRLLYASHGLTPDIQYRSGGPAGLVPYLEFSFPKESVCTIVVGPSESAKLRRRLVAQILEVYDYRVSNIPIIKSKVPYRK
ncbi:DUF2971 domain-containing protein (plasmid) [Rhodococcus qingshengii]|uniref:DUF2971 domain-containing protein n=1 Tax=Rhodococcus qingshengii TaxID=334542 RepID=UPI00311C9B68